MKLFILLFVTALTMSSSVSPRKKVNANCIGIIETKSPTDKSMVKYHGSAFVLFEKNIVITCAHVADKLDTMHYKPALSQESYLLEKIKSIQEIDISILRIKGDIGIPPLELNPSITMGIGDTIEYVGYDKPKTISDNAPNMTAKRTTITSFGFDDFYFEGYCHTGFSGSVIFDTDAKVVGFLKAGRVLNEEQNLMEVQCGLFNSRTLNKIKAYITE